MKIKVSFSDYLKFCRDCSWIKQMFTPAEEILEQQELFVSDRNPVVLECSRPTEFGECKVPRITE